MAEGAREAAWEPPRTFDSFEIQQKLGVGGMGHVYLGRDVMLDRRVALKFIASSSPSPESRGRFLIEARAIAKLAHPNVVGVFRIGEVEGRPYIAYEFVDGLSLDSIARPLPWGAALRIATLLARGLEAAHRVGIVHRDVKPSNVMLSSTGQVKLLDFGIAKLDAGDGEATAAGPLSLRRFQAEDVPFAPTESDNSKLTGKRSALTRPGSLIGTPAYLAPEVWGGESASPRSDVFALGLVLYELLTGALPFAPLAGHNLAEAVIERDIPAVRSRRPDVPPAFALIVDKCLRRDPRLRHETATELRAELEHVKSVYLPRADQLDDVRLAGEARVVADSFGRMLGRTDELVSGVYTKLFEADPTVRPLFPEDLSAQKTKLAHALKLAIQGLHEPDRIAEILRELGRRHGNYGVTAEHFETLGHALHATVREIDAEAWSDELSQAWRQAYAFIATAMRQGLAGAATTAVSQIESPWPAVASTPPSVRRRVAEVQSMPVPRTQYARNGEVSLAYHVLGEGPDLVVSLGFVTHLELAYAHPSLSDFLRALAEEHRVILFDKRGTGLSDRVLDSTTGEERADDIRAVMDAAGSARAAILGVGDGAALAAWFAARHPARLRGLVAWAASARVLNAPGYEDGLSAASFEQLIDTMRERWGDTVFAELGAPSMATDRAFTEWLATYMRTGASPGNAVALLKASAALDVRPILPAVSAPTLVMHRRADRIAPSRGGKAFADLVPGALWLELDGEDHTPFTGDVASVLAPMLTFLQGLPPA